MKTYYFLITLLLVSCKQKQLFEFDKINHYQISLSEDEESNLYDLTNKSHADSLYNIILNQDEPISLNDTGFLNSLKLPKIKMNQINDNKLAEFRLLFKEKISWKTNYKCEPIYRDVLIFQNNDKVNGIAKICFECNKYYMIGTIGDDSSFGTEKDFKTLKHLLVNK